MATARLFIADGDELWEIVPDGSDSHSTLPRDFPSGLTGPNGMTNLNGRLFIADGDELWELDPDGSDSHSSMVAP